MSPRPARVSTSWKADRVRRAAASCSGVVQKIAERYAVPMSLPCRLPWVGSWFSQKALRSSSGEVTDGS